MMLLQHATTAATHVLDGSVAQYLWALPVLPLLGFVLNGLISIISATTIGPADPVAAHAHGADDAHAPAGAAAQGSAHAADHAHDSTPAAEHHVPVRHRFAWLVSIIGPAVLALSFALAVAMFGAMNGAHMEAAYVQTYFRWMPVGDLQINAALQLDQLSMVMVLVITGVGTLIHIFSVGYMRDDPGYPRYFAYLNLFVFFMLVLVLGANYPMLFIGWEGVGLCSYLLIGFWFSVTANADAGKKAFIMNRIGDFGFLVAMFLLFGSLGTLDFAGVNAAAGELEAGGALVTAICLFLFLGCTGKSAQIPLYTWLPDAMAGPTPVSALIHAATMVTAGVYLIARSAVLFSMAPAASLTVAVIGAVTALFAATIGLKQWDIKKVLAYSTVSQLGYMFIGVGVGAYTAGIFHLVTHAFFKALLFLGSGSVIYAMHHAYHATHNEAEDAQDMRNMGGLARYMRVTWILMWIATLAIAGIPLFAGFFSKDEVLGGVFTRMHGSTLADVRWLGIPGTTVLAVVYAFGLAAALLTAIYMTRMMLYTFHGPNRTGDGERSHLHSAPWIMTLPLVVLGILSVAGGWLNVPHLLASIGPEGMLHHWLEPVVGPSELRITQGSAPHLDANVEWVLIGAAVAIAILGIVVALVRLRPAKLVSARQAPVETGFERVLAHKYFVDEGYDRVVVQPVVKGSRYVLWKGIDVGLIDNLGINWTAWRGSQLMGWLGSRLQSGQVGTYAWVLVAGVIAVLGAFTLR